MQVDVGQWGQAAEAHGGDGKPSRGVRVRPTSLARGGVLTTAPCTVLLCRPPPLPPARLPGRCPSCGW